MTGKEITKVQEDVECEGFDNTFVHYDDYVWVADPEFHRLRNTYLEARKQLGEYIGVDPNN